MRGKSTLRGPTKPLDGFPAKRWGAEKAFFRAAGRRENGRWYGPWWFCNCLDCRFDLDGGDGYGTIYAAETVVAAMAEYLGEALAFTVTPIMLAKRRVYTLRYDKGFNLAHVSDRRATGHGAQRELTGGPEFDVPQQWAQALHDCPGDGFDGRRFEGIYYNSRYNLADDEYALAVFHWKGPHDWPHDGWRPGTDDEIVRELLTRGVAVAPAPILTDLQLIE